MVENYTFVRTYSGVHFIMQKYTNIFLTETRALLICFVFHNDSIKNVQ